jgi:hypothetical protein
VREVDQLQDAVDERVAERDQPVDGAVRDPDQEDVDERRRPLGEVADQPDEEQGDEDDAEDVGDAPAAEDARSRKRAAGVGWRGDGRRPYRL